MRSSLFQRTHTLGKMSGHHNSETDGCSAGEINQSEISTPKSWDLRAWFYEESSGRKRLDRWVRKKERHLLVGAAPKAAAMQLVAVAAVAPVAAIAAVAAEAVFFLYKWTKICVCMSCMRVTRYLFWRLTRLPSERNQIIR